jgi:flagellar hook-associated protein 2
LNISAIVSSLTSAFGAAQTNQLTNQSNALNAQVSAFGTFSSALDTLQATLTTLEDPAQLAGFDATVADKTIASATTTSDAVAGQYSLEVQNLATAATLTSQPLASPTAVGTGTLTIAVGGASASINIDSSDNTLAGIASAINSAPNNPGSPPASLRPPMARGSFSPAPHRRRQRDHGDPIRRRRRLVVVGL